MPYVDDIFKNGSLTDQLNIAEVNKFGKKK